MRKLVRRTTLGLVPVTLPRKPERKRKPPSKQASHLEVRVRDLLNSNLPVECLDDLHTQYHFHTPKKGEKRRRWAFDFAFPTHKVAIECEGGIYLRGRGGWAKGHAHPKRLEEDMVKYNTAAIQGWKVLRFGTKLVCENEEYVLRTVKEALNV